MMQKNEPNVEQDAGKKNTTAPFTTRDLLGGAAELIASYL